MKKEEEWTEPNFQSGTPGCTKICFSTSTSYSRVAWHVALWQGCNESNFRYLLVCIENSDIENLVRSFIFVKKKKKNWFDP